MRPSRARRGFTLLEVTLALSVGVLLLGALYVAVDVQLRHARAGRRVVEQATLARSILARMDADITAAATLIDSERFRIANNTASSSSASTTTATTASGGGGATSSSSTSSATSGSGGTSTSGSSSASTSTSAVNDAVTLPLSVQGDNATLHLFITRLPREAISADPNATAPIVSDLRRVSWWLPGGGLARQEIPVPTSQDALDNLPPGIADEDSYVIAAEVKNLQFQYFDGTDWVDSWDCTSPGADGVTPIGPPLAVSIVLEIEAPQEGAKDDDTPTKRYRHVVACLTANGAAAQTAQQGTTGGTGQ